MIISPSFQTLLLKCLYTVFLGVSFFCPLTTAAAERDTVLNTVYSNPFFYNVLTNKAGTIYAGTSEGVFEIDGTNLKRYNQQKGYITLDKKGDPVINKEGLRNYFERKYSYLLPFPELAREEYHAGTLEHFYICAGGRIYIFAIVPYTLSYDHHSIRTISENFVGTYSGIYLKGNKLKKIFPSFTDGYIREIEGYAYVCYDWLLKVDPEIIRTGKIDSVGTGVQPINCNQLVQFRDAFRSNLTGNFYYASVTDLLKKGKNDSIESIYNSKTKIREVVLIGENKSLLYFSDGAYIIVADLNNDKVDTLHQLTAEVVDGSITGRNIYVLTNEGLYVIKTDKEIEKLTNLYQAHTLELISATELVISTNTGLFSFNTVSKTLSTLISGIEFNAKALFKKGDLLQVGSTNGLYTININDLDQLITKNKAIEKKETLPIYVIIVLFVAITIILVLVFLLIRSRNKLVIAAEEIKELNMDSLDRAKIEQYIRENLTTVSIKSITNHFDTNISHVYKLISPDKPGSIIQKLRIEKLVELKNAGKTVAEIAEATGLSTSYVVKIKNRSKLDD